MRLAFLGTPDFAVPALRALAAAHEVVCVYTQPPRAAGRGQAPRVSAVHAAADVLGLPVRTPASLRDPDTQAAFASLALETAVVAAYGLILPPAILDTPARGCVNIHASLLPRWRGAAPIQAAILAGDTQTGVTIMRMEAGLDTGPMFLSETVPIGPRATAADLHDTLATLGARLLLRVLATWPEPVPQPEGSSYAPKLAKADGRLDFTRDAAALDRVVRALNPWPGVWTTLGGRTLKVLQAEPTTGGGPPGETLDAALTVACGSDARRGEGGGALRLTRVQLAGRGPLDAAAFVRGTPVPPGTMLGASSPEG